MNRGKAVVEDGLSIDLIKDTSDILPDKLGVLFVKFLQTHYVPRTWENATIILIYMKEDLKNLKKTLQKARRPAQGSSCYSNTPLLPTTTSHPHS